MKIHVENLKCGGCASTVTSSLLKLKGVKKVKVDLDKDLVIVEGDPNRDELVKELERLGYPQSGHNSILKKTKSYVSCAIGRIQGKESKTSD